MSGEGLKPLAAIAPAVERTLGKRGDIAEKKKHGSVIVTQSHFFCRHFQAFELLFVKHLSNSEATRKCQSLKLTSSVISKLSFIGTK